MNNTTKYVGLDVSKQKIVVAVAKECRSKLDMVGLAILYSQLESAKAMVATVRELSGFI